MSTYLDYRGRTVDVLAFRGQRPAGEALLRQTLADALSGGEVCAGAQMTAQAWVVEFLTEEGSVPYDPDAGCGFMTAARQGRLLTELDVAQQFNLSAAKVRRRLLATNRAAAPADEQFADAELRAVTVTPGGAAITVAVSTAAGTAREVILPLPLTP